MTSQVDATLLSRAEDAARAIAPLAARIEADRQLPPEAVDALVRAGALKLLVPRVHGGAEATAETFVSVVETIARADGSAGWCTMIAGGSGLMSMFLAPEVAHEVYAPDDAITCGVVAPMGRAARVEHGYRVSGRWPFGSASKHSQWIMGGTIAEGDSPLPSGAPDIRSALFRASDVQILDTWDVSGLRGTGSHDFAVKDVIVPRERTFSLITTPRTHEGPLARLPFFGTLASGVAAVSLGIGRAAIDALIALATKKQQLGAKQTIAHRETVQLEVARIEARLRGARAFLFDALGEAGREAARDGEATVRSRALLRAAACHAASESARVVTSAYELGGGTSIYASSPLQRHLRDVHTASQHLMVASPTATTAGRVLLGLDAETATL
ncbi:acyl-CoA dehydrogenase family protein [Sandaracinus amylolyticus]|uniref:acyl-CoA dehydrogenase family protein n=1 Tax=Sandaracinus amylolyticus TaxID=927083 RepID=UPI001F30A916|nr:acyl-CoA dehydrogenase family protein [Sandaracinus amylolyticus]UJR83062.1 Hypothetical protein I5071_51280 [Sandaracinus amylolyticus]